MRSYLARDVFFLYQRSRRIYCGIERDKGRGKSEDRVSLKGWLSHVLPDSYIPGHPNKKGLAAAGWGDRAFRLPSRLEHGI